MVPSESPFYRPHLMISPRSRGVYFTPPLFLPSYGCSSCLDDVISFFLPRDTDLDHATTAGLAVCQACLAFNSEYDSWETRMLPSSNPYPV